MKGFQKIKRLIGHQSANCMLLMLKKVTQMSLLCYAEEGDTTKLVQNPKSAIGIVWNHRVKRSPVMTEKGSG